MKIRPLRCLLSTHPSNCPLCRKAYIPERVKKLHVDPFSETVEDDVVFQINRHLRKLALASGEDTPEGDAMDVIREANSWLASRGQSDRVVSVHTPFVCASYYVRANDLPPWCYVILV